MLTYFFLPNDVVVYLGSQKSHAALAVGGSTIMKDCPAVMQALPLHAALPPMLVSVLQTSTVLSVQTSGGMVTSAPATSMFRPKFKQMRSWVHELSPMNTSFGGSAVAPTPLPIPLHVLTPIQASLPISTMPSAKLPMLLQAKSPTHVRSPTDTADAAFPMALQAFAPRQVDSPIVTELLLEGLPIPLHALASTQDRGMIVTSPAALMEKHEEVPPLQE
mmetsp:Transcript_23124/g.65518  ORF Transcript_23124/g.65518 Transcript_23124/m.65518 type:complete len:219 (+) Transcript_23124:17-673(+)